MSEPIEILKVDDELGLIFGWATVTTHKGEPVVDAEGDVIQDREMLVAATEFMKAARVGGLMHFKDADGKVIQTGSIVHSWPMTEEIKKAFGIRVDSTGWLIGMEAPQELRKRVKSGELRGFSIGGSAVRELAKIGDG